MAEGSSEGEKLKPTRGCIKSKAKKSPAKLAKGNMDMNSTSSKDEGGSGRGKLKRIRGCLKGKAKGPPMKLAKSNMNINSTPSKEMLSVDISNGNSKREKLKPVRSCLRELKSQDKVAESNMDMDKMSLKDMLRFLDEEEVLLTQLQSKVSEELSRLQVEEHVFLRTLQIFGEKDEGTSCKGNENQQQSSREDQELIDALHLALKDNGQFTEDNVELSEPTCT